MTRRRDDVDDEGASHRDEVACPYHSGHEEILQHHEAWLGDLKIAIEKTGERILAVDKKLVEVWTTVKVGVAVGVAVGSASGTVIGLVIAWMK